MGHLFGGGRWICITVGRASEIYCLSFNLMACARAKVTVPAHLSGSGRANRTGACIGPLDTCRSLESRRNGPGEERSRFVGLF